MKLRKEEKRGRGRPATTNWPDYRQQISSLLPVSFKALEKSGKAVRMPKEFRAHLSVLAKTAGFEYLTVSINAREIMVVKTN